MAIDTLIGIFDHTLFFIFVIILAFAVLGWLTGSFSVGLFSGFLTFIHITTEQDIGLLTNLLYIAMVAVLFFFAFRLYGFAFDSSGVET